jgi:oxygen tolerance protein BatD
MKLLTINIILLFLANSLFAQEYSIRASVNKNKVALNERFEYKLEISGKSTSLPNPKIPELKNFALVGGPNTSTSIQYVNGAMSASNTYSYILMPRNIGKHTIPNIVMEIDGEKYESNTITIEVVKQKAQTQKKQSKAKTSTDQNLLGEKLYLKAQVDKRNVYQHEQILITYKLYFRASVRSYSFDKIPSTPGFWEEEFKLPGQPPISREIVNGVEYQVATLRQLALFPTQSGEFNIEPLSITVDAVVKRKKRSRSVFDSFFDDPFGQTVRQSLSSNSIKIKVKELPTNGKPINFNGIVGKYSMSLSSDKNQVRANDAVSLKLNIVGEGNIKLVVAPKLNVPPDLEVYDPKEKTNIKREKGKVTGQKNIEYIVVPRYEGDYTIKPVTLSYFDPKARKYKTLKTKAVELQVVGGVLSLGDISASTTLSKQEVELLGKDIRFIKEIAYFTKQGNKIYTNTMFLSGFVFPLILIGLAFGFKKHQVKLEGDVQFARRRKAGKIATKHLVHAKKYMNTETSKEFYKFMSKALQGFVSDKLSIDMTDFTVNSVKQNLEKIKVKEEEIKEYQDCLQESDYMQFAGKNSETTQMNTFFDKSKKCLTNLEKYI